MEDIKTVIETMNFPVREQLSFSFGDIEQCKDLFIDIFSEVDKTASKIYWLPEYIKVIEWMVDTQGKGLALFGSIGRGKTVINSFIIPILFYRRYGKILRPRIAQGLTRENLSQCKWAYIIDDIGTEEIVNEYGTKTDMVSYAINNAEHYLKPLFLTSNLTKDELIQRYGLRTFDRINRLCKIIVFKGKSLRQ